MNHDFHGRNFIANELLAGGKETFQAVDPASGEQLEPGFHEATAEEIDQALRRAEAAFEANRSRPAGDWADLLERIAVEIEALGDRLTERVVAETALGAVRVRSERGRTTGQARLFAEVVREGSWVEARIDRAVPDRKPLPKPDLRRMLIPLGPVVVFGASNFPLAFSVAGGDTVSALAAGCPVVVKAHPAHPGTSELVAGAVRAAVEAMGFHPGTFSMVQGRSPEVSMALVRHPATKAVGFTGSLRVGRALFDAAAARPEPIPVYAEMGSINPVFVLPGALDAQGESIAEGLVGSVTLGAGQFCTAPGLVVGLDGAALERFTGSVGQRIAETPAFALLNEGIRAGYEQGVRELTLTPGVHVAGRSNGGAGGGGAWAGAAVLVTDEETFLHNRRLGEEVFGPSTLVVRCTSKAMLERIARSLEGSLTATLHGTPADLAAHGDLVHILASKAGRLIFNGFPTGVEVCPSMHHGGPYPATSDVRTTSVGTAAITRFARPVCYQNFPQEALPPELQDRNVRGLWRLVDSTLTRDDL